MIETEKLIEQVNKIAVELSHGGDSAACAAPALLENLLKKLKDELKSEAASAAGRLSAKKAADKILKQLAEYGKPCGAYISGGRQIIGGAYSCVRLAEPLPVQELFEASAVNYAEILSTASQNSGDVLTLPSLAELTASNKTQKALNKSVKKFAPQWDFGAGLPLVNGEKLAEILTILGDGATAHASKHNPLTAMIYFENARGDDAVLAPMRKPAR